MAWIERVASMVLTIEVFTVGLVLALDCHLATL